MLLCVVTSTEELKGRGFIMWYLSPVIVFCTLTMVGQLGCFSSQYISVVEDLASPLMNSLLSDAFIHQ